DIVHLGVSASNEKRDDDLARVRVRPEAFLTDVRLVDSGSLSKVEAIDRLGLEAIWQRGPVLLQSEYLHIDVDRTGLRDYRADGYYVSAAWVLTGEKRSYKSAAFGNVKPKRAGGAVELAARYSRVDLNDRGVSLGGSQRDWTLAVNWYLSTHFKLQANYVMVDSERRGLSLDPNVGELRMQVYF
ncbi:MAG: OprO/OprP family phosphate-selective porin, partial [Lysobacter sp.]